MAKNEYRRPTEAKPKERSGARHSKTKHSDRLRGYLSHHRLVAVDSLKRLLITPFSSLMTWLVIGVALVLPTGMLLLLLNLQTVSANWNGAAQLSVFMKQGVSELKVKQVVASLDKRQDLAAVRYVSPAQALDEYQQLSGFGRVLEALPDNPLPALLVLSPASTHSSAEAVKAISADVEKIPEVDRVVLDMEWVQRLHALMALGQRMVTLLAVILALGVLLVVGNTIRLAIESRREEIIIVKLVGGTNAFVRRPFLYTGLWYGLGGGLVAWLILWASMLWLDDVVVQLVSLYGGTFSMAGLGVLKTMTLWAVSGLLGILGAWLAVGRHLGKIEPR